VRFLREHSLSIVLGGFAIGFEVISAVLSEGWWRDFLLNYSGDAFGAWLIVVMSKWFIERGSAESK
jgi:hypothetical protein